MDDKLATSMRDLLERREPRVATAEFTEVERVLPLSDDEYVAFANGRIGNRAQLSLDFRKSNGAAYAFSYTHLFSVESENPDLGFTVTFSAGKSVIVRGQQLSRLFESICRHRAAEIVEATRSQALEMRQSAVVTSIEFPTRARVGI